MKKNKNEFEDVNYVLVEIGRILKYAAKNECKIKKLPEKFKSLNYFIADCKNYRYRRKYGRLNYFNMASCEGVCIPFVNDDVIEDIVIIINEKNKDNPLYVTHELLHFLSTNLNEQKELVSGIDNYDSYNYLRSGTVAVNEGLTDYFAYKICGNYYDEKYFDFGCKEKRVHQYHYSTLLVNLLALEDKDNESKLFNAYINNDIEYIYDTLYKAFGLNRNKIEYLFERGEEFALDKSDEIGYRIYLEDIEEVIKYYYNNYYSKKNKDVNFVENYLNLFK